MNITIHEYKQAPDWWDKEVKEHSGVFCGTSYWIRSFTNLGIGNGKYIEVKENEKRILLLAIYDILLGGPILLFLPKFILQFLTRIPFLRSYNLHLQPTVIDKSLKNNEKKLVAISEEVLAYILHLAKKEHKHIIPADYICLSDFSNAKELQQKFPKETELIATARLYLNDENVETLYKNLDESVKSSIRKAKKLGLVIKKLDFSEVEKFTKGLVSGWKNYHLTVNHPNYYINLLDNYSEYISYYVALDGDEIAAGSAIMSYGKTMVEFSMFVTPYGREKKIPGSDAIKWELIQKGIKEQYNFFDFNMITIEDEKPIDSKIKNINFYKLKWGGKILYGIKITKLSTFGKQIQKLKHYLLGK